MLFFTALRKDNKKKVILWAGNFWQVDTRVRVWVCIYFCRFLGEFVAFPREFILLLLSLWKDIYDRSLEIS